MGDFPVVMFDEDTTEPEKNKQIPSEKKNKKTHLHTSSHFCRVPWLHRRKMWGLCALVDTNRLVDLRCPAMSGCLALRRKKNSRVYP